MNMSGTILYLQVNSIVDVGSSYYSQLQKLHGTENANVHVTAATQQTQAPVSHFNPLRNQMGSYIWAQEIHNVASWPL